MKRIILFVLVLALGLAAEVANVDFTFGEPTNMGPTVNSTSNEQAPSISADGRTLFFASNRPGGSGGQDLYVMTRETIHDDWGDCITESIKLTPHIIYNFSHSTLPYRQKERCEMR